MLYIITIYSTLLHYTVQDIHKYLKLLTKGPTGYLSIPFRNYIQVDICKIQTVAFKCWGFCIACWWCVSKSHRPKTPSHWMKVKCRNRRQNKIMFRYKFSVVRTSACCYSHSPFCDTLCAAWPFVPRDSKSRSCLAWHFLLRIAVHVEWGQLSTTQTIRKNPWLQHDGSWRPVMLCSRVLSCVGLFTGDEPLEWYILCPQCGMPPDWDRYKKHQKNSKNIKKHQKKHAELQDSSRKVWTCLKTEFTALIQ